LWKIALHLQSVFTEEAVAWYGKKSDGVDVLGLPDKVAFFL
jgi:hypothetical protein